MAEPLPAPFLKFEDGDGREIQLNCGNVWKIGRTEQNTVMLPDDMVSRNHAIIQQMDGGEFFLIDMGSRNGSFVNGRRVSAPVALRDGDRLSFGEARLCFCNPAEVAATRAAASISPEAAARGETVALFKQDTVSVLVVDIRGFTVLAQKIDADLLSRLVSTWFADADRIIHDHGGMAPKHIGDAVMAVWAHGVPGNEPLDILRILRAVAEIARMTGRLHETLQSGGTGANRRGSEYGTGYVGQHRRGKRQRFYRHRRQCECGLPVGIRQQGAGHRSGARSHHVRLLASVAAGGDALPHFRGEIERL